MNQLPTRKKNRFENITYTENGVYFITICSKDKKCIFSKIIPGADESLAPEIRLSKTGEIINTAINEIGNHYDNVSVVNYVIMPNHIHLLISIGDSGGRMISGLACRLGRRFSPRAEVSTGDPRPYGRRKP